MEHRLGGADHENQVGLDQCPIDPERKPAARSELDEIRIGGVVHLELAGEPPAELVGNEALELAGTHLPAEPARDENRLTLQRDADALQLGDRRSQGVLSGIADGARYRKLRWLDDDGRPPAAGRKLLQGTPGEREPQRLAHCRTDVRELLGRRRRPKHVRVGGHVDDRQPRPGEERDPH